MTMKTFRKVLIANRGEIAVRVIRTLRQMGIRSVAVFSEADRDALHVLLADEAYPIGPPPPRESYLNIQRILDVARQAGVDAVHPGYGFLSENPEFAEAVAAAGITFIGPSPESMRLSGDKVAARKVAMDVGVPVVPGSPGAVETVEEARRFAEAAGFPVLLKAAMGGGGKGMRVVHTPEELDNAFRQASAEALQAFGHPGLYVEKFLVEPRHVEFQILADHHGNVVHLFERECSIQRRHQKLVEESPSPALTPELREKMGEAAVRLMKAIGYAGAGTVEFLLDREGNFYFMEINARLQVEHPVTEMITGLDLVAWQIRVAQGEPLSFKQEDLVQRGYAVEARIFAEDPFHHFLPSPGVIEVLREPSGPFIRVDSGVYEGARVPAEYDPMLAKLVVWGENRKEGLARMRTALAEYWVGGVETTLPFHIRLFSDPEFVNGRYSVQFLARRKDLLSFETPRHLQELSFEEEVALTVALRENPARRSGQQETGPTPRSVWTWVARREATGQ